MFLVDFKIRTNGFKENIKGFQLTHKNQSESQLKKNINFLNHYFSNLNVSDTVSEYQDFLVNSQNENLDSITAQAIWL